MNVHLTEISKHGMFIVQCLLYVSIPGDHFWNTGSW